MKTIYTIHDVAALLGLSADAIRLYEKNDLVHPIRDEQNGYRYYDFDKIHRIMGISLYRQLGVSIADIKELIKDDSFSEIIDDFSRLIADNEREINRLNILNEKLQYMKQHLDHLNSGLDTFSLCNLDACYILHHQENTTLLYEDLKYIFTSPVFSYGNFGYLLSAGDNSIYHNKALEFSVRKPMLGLTEWNCAIDSLPVRQSCRCVYTVRSMGMSMRDIWDLSDMVTFAHENNCKCGDEAYVFYVYSIMKENEIKDYYEIFLPVT